MKPLKPFPPAPRQRTTIINGKLVLYCDGCRSIEFYLGTEFCRQCGRAFVVHGGEICETAMIDTAGTEKR